MHVRKASMHPRIKSIGREILSFGLIALVLLAARSTLADHYTVPSGSMEYTLMPGDRIFVAKYSYGFRFPFTDWKLTQGREVVRGEVVVFDSPVEDIRLVKRIVAVSGDSVSIRSGQVSINGHPMGVPWDLREETYGDRKIQLNLTYSGGEDFGPTVIPPGSLLAIGDARGNSKDGRAFGFISEDSVYGRAVAVYYRSGDGLCWLKL